MIALLSPAKTLDFEKEDIRIEEKTIPQFTAQTNQLIQILKKKTVDEIQELMHISEKLALLNRSRYRSHAKEYTEENSKTSIMAFKGDVYTGLDAETLTRPDLDFANEHIRILSGLYGVLRPYDRMQPYRLEMGTRLENKKGANLYHFWGDMITKALNKDLKAMGSSTVVNLASNEYFKAVDSNKLKADIIEVDFREVKEGAYKFVSFYAKKARGLMARYIVEQRIQDVADLRGFDYEGYRYVEEASGPRKLLFVR